MLVLIHFTNVPSFLKALAPHRFQFLPLEPRSTVSRGSYIQASVLSAEVIDHPAGAFR